MRRSLAPSQQAQRRSLEPAGASRTSASSSTAHGKKGDDVVIERLPLFGFLSIPDNINKKFTIPGGCIITEASIALRKVKTLGYSRAFKPIRPGDHQSILPNMNRGSLDAMQQQEGGDSDEEDGGSKAPELPPFEPLVLWEEKMADTVGAADTAEVAGGVVAVGEGEEGAAVSADSAEAGVEVAGGMDLDRQQPSARPRRAPHRVEVVPELACKLRPHQREGVQFLFDCTMGMRGFNGQGCILADDMGLGKTLMSITLLWTLLNQGITGKPGDSAVKKVVVVCPTSLVGNWDNEIRKWVGDRCHTFAVKSEPQKIIKLFMQHRGRGVLIVSYETQRRYSTLFVNKRQQQLQQQRKAELLASGATAAGAAGDESDNVTSGSNNVCDLLICDEAHKLKNAESGLAKSLDTLPARKRILLSGTPMQNDLMEFYNMVSFANPGILGTPADFRRKYERPILASREPHASATSVAKATKLQHELSTIVNAFILKRGNILNARHLPPKLVQYVCCRLTPLQERLYDALITNKEVRYVRDSKQINTLNSIRLMLQICSHPRMLSDAFKEKKRGGDAVDEELEALVEVLEEEKRNGAGAGGAGAMQQQQQQASSKGPGVFGNAMRAIQNHSAISAAANGGASRSLRTGIGGYSNSSGGGKSSNSGGSGDGYINPYDSGKFLVLYRLMMTMRALAPAERIVVVSNYTSTLDLLQAMCEQNNWPVCRLDGSTNATKRTKLVDTFNNPASMSFCFLLSSKAGGCGINLIGGNRLVMFDPDWNPASDKQAAARVWREGQKRRCYVYRFMSTATIEEKIIQRQLSKEGLQSIVDDKDQVNEFSTDELKALFAKRRTDTLSDTHDTLRCTRCSTVTLQQRSHEIAGGGSRGGGSMGARLQFNVAQVEECLRFLDELTGTLRTKIYAVSAGLVDIIAVISADTGADCEGSEVAGGGANSSGTSGDNKAMIVSLDDLDTLRTDMENLLQFLRSNATNNDDDGTGATKKPAQSLPFSTLPEFSKRLREAVCGLEKEYVARVAGIASHYKQFYSEGMVTGDDSGAADGSDGCSSSSKNSQMAAITEAKQLSISNEYMSRWCLIVERLTQLKSSSSSSSSASGDAVGAKKKNMRKKEENNKEPAENTDGKVDLGGKEGSNDESDDGSSSDDDEDSVVDFVEQEGCPEEEDFNRWSHHSTIDTVDDECLRRAMMDDPAAISFVFGLEVNWTLLQGKMAEQEAAAAAAKEAAEAAAALKADEVESSEVREGSTSLALKGGKKGKCDSTDELPATDTEDPDASDGDFDDRGRKTSAGGRESASGGRTSKKHDKLPKKLSKHERNPTNNGTNAAESGKDGAFDDGMFGGDDIFQFNSDVEDEGEGVRRRGSRKGSGSNSGSTSNAKEEKKSSGHSDRLSKKQSGASGRDSDSNKGIRSRKSSSSSLEALGSPSRSPAVAVGVSSKSGAAADVKDAGRSKRRCIVDDDDDDDDDNNQAPAAASKAAPLVEQVVQRISDNNSKIVIEKPSSMESSQSSSGSASTASKKQRKSSGTAEASSAPWACAVCTFENRKSVSRCAVCSSKRIKPIESSGGSSSTAPAGEIQVVTSDALPVEAALAMDETFIDDDDDVQEGNPVPLQSPAGSHRSHPKGSRSSPRISSPKLNGGSESPLKKSGINSERNSIALATSSDSRPMDMNTCGLPKDGAAETTTSGNSASIPPRKSHSIAGGGSRLALKPIQSNKQQ